MRTTGHGARSTRRRLLLAPALDCAVASELITTRAAGLLTCRRDQPLLETAEADAQPCSRGYARFGGQHCDLPGRLTQVAMRVLMSRGIGDLRLEGDQRRRLRVYEDEASVDAPGQRGGKPDDGRLGTQVGDAADDDRRCPR
jgi:hypothetical protein